MITHSVEINRSPEDVFAYLDKLDRYVEWQENLISTRVETEGPTQVGSRGVDRRRVPGGPRDIPFEVTQHDLAPQDLLPRDSRSRAAGRHTHCGASSGDRSGPPASGATSSCFSATSVDASSSPTIFAAAAGS